MILKFINNVNILIYVIVYKIIYLSNYILTNTTYNSYTYYFYPIYNLSR